MVRVVLICVQEGKRVWQLGHRHKWSANGRKKTGESLNINTTYSLKVLVHNHYYDGMQQSIAHITKTNVHKVHFNIPKFKKSDALCWSMSGCWNFFLSCFADFFILSICDKAYCCTSIFFPWHIVLNWWPFIPCNIKWKLLVACEIWGSHNGGDKDSILLVCDAIRRSCCTNHQGSMHSSGFDCVDREYGNC